MDHKLPVGVDPQKTLVAPPLVSLHTVPKLSTYPTISPACWTPQI